MTGASSKNEARNLVLLDVIIKCKQGVNQPLDQLVTDLLVTKTMYVPASTKDLLSMLVNNHVDLTPFVTPSISARHDPELLTEFSRHGLLSTGTLRELFAGIVTAQELKTLTSLAKFHDPIEFNSLEPSFEAFETLLKWSNDFGYAFNQISHKIQEWDSFWNSVIAHQSFDLFATNTNFINHLKSVNRNRADYGSVFVFMWNSGLDASPPDELTAGLISQLEFMPHNELTWEFLHKAVILADDIYDPFIEKARHCHEFPSILITRHCKAVMSDGDLKMIQAFADLPLKWPANVTRQLLDAIYVRFDLPNTVYSCISTFNLSFQVESCISSGKEHLLHSLRIHIESFGALHQHPELECVTRRLLQDLGDDRVRAEQVQFSHPLHNSWTDLLMLLVRMDEDIKMGSLSAVDGVDSLQQALNEGSIEEVIRVSAQLVANPGDALHYIEECLLSDSVNLDRLLSVINLCCQNKVKPFTLRSGTIAMILSKHPPHSIEFIKFINHAARSTAVTDEFWIAQDPSLWAIFREDHDEFQRALLNEAIAHIYERNLQIPELEEHARSLWNHFITTADVTLCKFAGAYGMNNSEGIELKHVLRLLHHSNKSLLLLTRFLFNVLLDRTLVALKSKLAPENANYSAIFPWPQVLFTTTPQDLICIDMLLIMAEGCREDVQLYNTLYSVFRDDLSTPILEHLLRSLLEAHFDPSCHEFSVVDMSACDDRLLVMANLYYRLLRSFPTACRLWFDTLPRDIQSQVEEYTRSHFSRLLINRELDRIRRGRTKDALTIEIEQSSTTLTVVAKYMIEEFGMQLRLSVPPSFPLKAISIVNSERLGLPEGKWRTWLLACQSVFSSQSFNGSIVDGLTLWSLTLSRSLEGLDPCPICYCILHPGDRTLPTPTCHTCKKKYHSACLYKWFKTGGQSTCPMCRALF